MCHSPDRTAASSQQGSNDLPDAIPSDPDVNITVDTSDEEVADVDQASYFKALNLEYFASQPLRMAFGHKHLMELCLENKNPEACYIEGINQYFFHKNSEKALDYLRYSAHGGYDDGTYLYGLLLLCTGRSKRGKRVIDRLRWEQSLDRANKCWRRIKKVLGDYSITLEEIETYLPNLAKLRRPRSCRSKKDNHLCNKCFYILRVHKFLNYVIKRYL